MGGKIFEETVAADGHGFLKIGRKEDLIRVNPCPSVVKNILK
jgi:hypothetical protein